MQEFIFHIKIGEQGGQRLDVALVGVVVEALQSEIRSLPQNKPRAADHGKMPRQRRQPPDKG